MDRDLDPVVVASRLETLRAAYVPETVEAGRARLRADEMAGGAWAQAVARRLEELRALDELTRYLHGAAGARAITPA